ncbi:MAG: hypothetical protein EU533_07370 [Promethearchaeota archaeon]|nr:MAG: hypothetical protein EU533_07370 [Candidatus Lokiarchaeota archaeon]
MRLLAIIGVVIMTHTLYFIIKLKNTSIQKRDISDKELGVFFLTAAIFFTVNFLIGYAWWDPNHVLGMGPLFFPSIFSLIALGLIPYVFRAYFKLDKKAFASSTNNFWSFFSTMAFIAYGYGLVSLLWHCCSFFEPKMFFFFFIIKFIQLWAMCSFFFMYGFKLLLNKFSHAPWIAYLIISILFGFCYPWHTIGFAFTFIIFGLGLCILVRKTDSFWPGLMLLYFAYIFHAGLAWQGPLITFAVIFPISISLLILIVYATFRLKI